MYSKLVVLTVLAVLAVVGFSVVEAKDKKKHHQCLGEDLKYSTEMMKAWGACHNSTKKDDDSSDESGEGKKEPKDKCAMDCVFRKLGLIDSDGKLDNTKIDEALKSVYPETAYKSIKADNDECAKKATGKLTTDDHCKDFQPYIHCHFESVKKHCTKKE